MKFPKTTSLSKINFFIAFIGFVLFVVGFAAPYWLKLDFILTGGPIGLDFDLDVTANMGLYTACKIIRYPNGNEETECSPDGAADWQLIAVGLGIGALVLAFVTCLLSFLAVVTERFANKNKIKVITAFLASDAAALFVGPLIMYAMNKKIQVEEDHPYRGDFELAWAYFISVVAAFVYGFLALLNIIEVISSSDGDGKGNLA